MSKLNHWLFFALLELLKSNKRKFSISKISKALSYPEKEVAQKIQILYEMGLIKKTASGFKSTEVRHTANTIRSVLDEIHAGYLDQAKGSMSVSREDERSISGTTILSSPSRMKEAIERIKVFRRSLADYLAIKPEDKEERLYRIQIALFPLEK